MISIFIIAVNFVTMLQSVSKAFKLLKKLNKRKIFD
jgi:hypothetical protein